MAMAGQGGPRRTVQRRRRCLYVQNGDVTPLHSLLNNRGLSERKQSEVPERAPVDSPPRSAAQSMSKLRGHLDEAIAILLEKGSELVAFKQDVRSMSRSLDAALQQFVYEGGGKDSETEGGSKEWWNIGMPHPLGCDDLNTLQKVKAKAMAQQRAIVFLQAQLRIDELCPSATPSFRRSTGTDVSISEMLPSRKRQRPAGRKSMGAKRRRKSTVRKPRSEVSPSEPPDAGIPSPEDDDAKQEEGGSSFYTRLREAAGDLVPPKMGARALVAAVGKLLKKDQYKVCSAMKAKCNASQTKAQMSAALTALAQAAGEPPAEAPPRRVPRRTVVCDSESESEVSDEASDDEEEEEGMDEDEEDDDDEEEEEEEMDVYDEGEESEEATSVSEPSGTHSVGTRSVPRTVAVSSPGRLSCPRPSFAAGLPPTPSEFGFEVRAGKQSVPPVAITPYVSAIGPDLSPAPSGGHVSFASSPSASDNHISFRSSPDDAMSATSPELVQERKRKGARRAMHFKAPAEPASGRRLAKIRIPTRVVPAALKKKRRSVAKSIAKTIVSPKTQVEHTPDLPTPESSSGATQKSGESRRGKAARVSLPITPVFNSPPGTGTATPTVHGGMSTPASLPASVPASMATGDKTPMLPTPHSTIPPTFRTVRRTAASTALPVTPAEEGAPNVARGILQTPSPVSVAAERTLPTSSASSSSRRS